MDKSVQLLLVKAISLHQGGLFSDAEQIYKKILLDKPTNFDALHLLGVLYAQSKKYQLALKLFNKAIKVNDYHADIYVNKGNIYREINNTKLALDNYNHAIRLNSSNTECYINKGILFIQIRKYESAIKVFNLSLSIDPNNLLSHIYIAFAYQELGIYNNSLHHFQIAFANNPNFEYLAGSYLYLLLTVSDWRNFENYLKNLFQQIISGHKVATPLTLLSIFDSPELQQKVAQSFVLDKCPPSNTIPTKPNRRHDRIRIAYFSSDFRSHAVSFLTAELFELHDRNRFDVYAFSLRRVSPEDKMSQRLLASFDHFYELEDQSSLDIAQLARSLEIDIAIDLNGHTQGAMSGIFADRAAPIQINYLGYPGTMGASYMDYIIADQHLIPQENRHFYTEKIIYLPHTFQVNDSKRKIGNAKLTRQDHLLPSSGFIFCCFNNAHKVNLDIFTAWMQILKGVPESYLWLLSVAPTTEENLRNQAQCLGVEPARLIFGGRLAPDEYLARFQMADLFLDTLPFNGGTTISDALWVGLPVLTQAGHSFAGRMGASLLNAVNLPQLITNSREDYIQMAIELGNNTDRLLEIKQTLAKELKKCPLFNSAQFTKNIESAFLTVYETYQNQEELSHVFVEDALI